MKKPINKNGEEHSVNAGDNAPTLLLLGKTGAGKSSLVQKLTGNSAAVVGSGFRPCTRFSAAYPFPQDLPLLNFLDTQGIDEAEATDDPRQEIVSLARQSQAIVVLARINDPAQSSVLSCLRAIKKLNKDLVASRLCVLHTHVDQVGNAHDSQRLRHNNQSRFDDAWGASIGHCSVDLSDPQNPHSAGTQELENLLLDLLPSAYASLRALRLRQDEEQAFSAIKEMVNSYATAAAASDSLPMVGLVTVPALQGKMLHSIASGLDLTWSPRLLAEFTGLLGGSIALKYAANLGGRQAAKAIPAWGQTAGAIWAATTSYASTFALGRTAFHYLFHKGQQQAICEDALRSIYREAFAAKNQRWSTSTPGV